MPPPSTHEMNGKETILFFFIFWQGEKKLERAREEAGVRVTAVQSGGERSCSCVWMRVSIDTGEHTEHPRVLDLHSKSKPNPLSPPHHHTVPPTQREGERVEGG